MKTSKDKSSKPLLKTKKKDVKKLIGRFNLDHLISDNSTIAKKFLSGRATGEMNFAQRRLAALNSRKKMRSLSVGTPVNPAVVNWTPVGPLAIPQGQTYGGVRVLVSGRITSIAADPFDEKIIYIGSARGGIWKTVDGGENWTPVSDDTDSLAIGALSISKSNPNVLYAGTGEGNLQFYSTTYALSSAPGIYLGVGVLKSADGGNTWATHGTSLFSNNSFYRIAIDPTTEKICFAATSVGLCRTMDGNVWESLSGNGLPGITASVIACTDVIIDIGDPTGNTVYCAFWGSGIYKSTDALSATPTWNLISTGLPTSAGISRISLAQSESMPEKIFALMASSFDDFEGVYLTTDATGENWTKIINAGISVYGAFTNNIAVDPTTPNIIYVSGVELYKGEFSGGTWTVSNIGNKIHPDSHGFGFNPNNSSVIYSGNDGGIYKSTNAGLTWSDSINEGICILQYEAMDQHPTSDAMILGGTQDNGTQLYRNHPVFYHSADGDGGYCNIDPTSPTNMIHTYYSPTPQRSTEAGKFGTFVGVNAGINGSGLFYPPMAISPVSARIALGTDRINIDDTQGTTGWPGTGTTLPGITGKVSAVSFASDTILYAATTSGKVYRLDLSGGIWTARNITAAPLPTGWIWDIGSVPGNPDEIIAVLSGFGYAHVWRGVVPPIAGAAVWTAISGAGATLLPDIPCYALAFRNAAEFYVGTDIGVFATTDSGATWNNYNQGLPNTAIYDLRFNGGSEMLRAATHGRGLWEIKVDAPNTTGDLFFRDNLMITGRFNSASGILAGFEDTLNHTLLGDTLHWWNCADIKIDSPDPAYQFSGPVNYFDFETKLEHRNAEIGNTNRVYIQVNNRGPLAVDDVWVKVMVADASAGLPSLPADFWTTFPNSAGDANWTPIGTPQKITRLNPLKPEVLQWNWKPETGSATHTCMLVIMDSVADPIPEVNKVFDIGSLVTNEKRVGLRNLHLVNLIADEPVVIDFHFHGLFRKQSYRVDLIKFPIPRDLYIDLILPKKMVESLATDKATDGFSVYKLPDKFQKQILRHFKEIQFRKSSYIERIFDEFDFTRSMRLNEKSKSHHLELKEFKFDFLRTFIVLSSTKKKIVRNRAAFHIIQSLSNDQRSKIIGGSTFIVKLI